MPVKSEKSAAKSKRSGSGSAGGKHVTATHGSRASKASAAKATVRTAAKARAATPAPAGVNEDGEALQALRRHLSEAIEQFSHAVQRIETDIERLADVTWSAPSEGFARVQKVFVAELKRLLGETAPDDDAVRRAA